jgi:hypothetical protein
MIVFIFQTKNILQINISMKDQPPKTTINKHQSPFHEDPRFLQFWIEFQPDKFHIVEMCENIK